MDRFSTPSESFLPVGVWTRRPAPRFPALRKPVFEPGKTIHEVEALFFGTSEPVAVAQVLVRGAAACIHDGRKVGPDLVKSIHEAILPVHIDVLPGHVDVLPVHARSKQLARP